MMEEGKLQQVRGTTLVEVSLEAKESLLPARHVTSRTTTSNNYSSITILTEEYLSIIFHYDTIYFPGGFFIVASGDADTTIHYFYSPAYRIGGRALTEPSLPSPSAPGYNMAGVRVGNQGGVCGRGSSVEYLWPEALLQKSNTTLPTTFNPHEVFGP